MLKFIEISQFALIDHLEIEFQKGLNLLTGETGSGKSIIVDALGLLLGDKGHAEMIRSGAEKALISGLFDGGDEDRLRQKLEESGLDGASDELIIKRELSAQGKGRAFVNNQLVPVGFLRELSWLLADVHGQNEAQMLYQADAQLAFLDAYAEAGTLRAEVQQIWLRRQEVWQQLQHLKKSEQQRLQTIDLLSFQVGEIEKAQLKGEDEDAVLHAEHKRLANADKLYQLSNQAYADLYDSETSASRLLKQAQRMLEDLKRLDERGSGFVEQLQSARIALEDLAMGLREYVDKIEVNPARLEWVENRIAEIERLKRKYGKSVKEILEFYSRSKQELESLEGADNTLAGLEKELAALAESYSSQARTLSEKRKTAARQLEKNVEKELGQLAMERTRFRLAFRPVEAASQNEYTLPGTAAGIDAMEFLISPNPGEDLKPLAKIASGGEISRIMLALKSVKAVDARQKCLVFDEVDAGIGGQTADVVGQKLKRLSRHNQVICVTHLPQIAAYADCHHFIEKKVEKGRTLTSVARLEGQQRVQEIARMISGERMTGNVLKHAADMIKTAGQ